MKTDWRKLRDGLGSNQPFGTFDTFDHRGHEGGRAANDDLAGFAKSANSVKRSKKASSTFKNPRTNSAKSAKSLPTVINSWEWITERAAILQFDAGLDRDQAEVQAFMCWYHYFVEAE